MSKPENNKELESILKSLGEDILDAPNEEILELYKEADIDPNEGAQRIKNTILDGISIGEQMNKDRKVMVIIAGGRDFTGYQELRDAFADFMDPYENHEVTIICGMAKGADLLGKQIAKVYNLPVIEMPADWDTHGKSAGFIRNEKMSLLGTHLLAAWDKKSKGTADMIDRAKRANLQVQVIYY